QEDHPDPARHSFCFRSFSMRTFAPVLLFAFSLVSAASLSIARAELPGDAPGAKDFPDVPRYEGSKILFQSEQAYGELALQIKGLAYPDSTDPGEVRLV